MKHAILKLDTTRAGQTKAGLVYAGLWVELDGLAFPAAAWTDAPVVALTWWAEVAIRLLRGDPGPMEARFMEGPYLARVRSYSPGEWELCLIDTRPDGRCEVAKVAAKALVSSISQACEATLELCRTRQWWSREATVLAAKTATLLTEVPGVPDAE